MNGPACPAGAVNVKPLATLPLTPGPLKMPPAGLARSSTGALPKQRVVSLARVAMGSGAIVTAWLVCTVQMPAVTE